MHFFFWYLWFLQNLPLPFELTMSLKCKSRWSKCPVRKAVLKKFTKFTENICIGVSFLTITCMNGSPSIQALPPLLDETYLVVVRGTYPLRSFSQVRQRGEYNWASRLQPSGQQIFSAVCQKLSKYWLDKIRKAFST